MSIRDERVAKNEAAAREINEEIEQVHDARPSSAFMHIVCECGYDTCDLFIAVARDDYERIRNDSRRFFVVKEHVILDVEDIVEENDRFTVVAKRLGRPAEVAAQTDPRG